MTVNGKARGVRQWAAARLLRGQPVGLVADVVRDVMQTSLKFKDSMELLGRLAAPYGKHVHGNPKRKEVTGNGE